MPRDLKKSRRVEEDLQVMAESDTPRDFARGFVTFGHPGIRENRSFAQRILEETVNGSVDLSVDLEIPKAASGVS